MAVPQPHETCESAQPQSHAQSSPQVQAEPSAQPQSQEQSSPQAQVPVSVVPESTVGMANPAAATRARIMSFFT